MKKEGQIPEEKQPLASVATAKKKKKREKPALTRKAYR
jgi:hypothetical protein